MQIVDREMGRGNDERSELQTKRDEVFDRRQVLGNGPEGGRVILVLGAWCLVPGAWCLVLGAKGAKLSGERRAAKKGT